LTTFNEGAYLKFKSIIHKALNDGMFAIWEGTSVFPFILRAKQWGVTAITAYNKYLVHIAVDHQTKLHKLCYSMY